MSSASTIVISFCSGECFKSCTRLQTGHSSTNRGVCNHQSIMHSAWKKWLHCSSRACWVVNTSCKQTTHCGECSTFFMENTLSISYLVCVSSRPIMLALAGANAVTGSPRPKQCKYIILAAMHIVKIEPTTTRITIKTGIEVINVSTH